MKFADLIAILRLQGDFEEAVKVVTKQSTISHSKDFQLDTEVLKKKKEKKKAPKIPPSKSSSVLSPRKVGSSVVIELEGDGGIKTIENKSNGKTTTIFNSKWIKETEEILTFLPNVPIQDIYSALELWDGNVDQVVDQLLVANDKQSDSSEQEIVHNMIEFNMDKEPSEDLLEFQEMDYFNDQLRHIFGSDATPNLSTQEVPSLVDMTMFCIASNQVLANSWIMLTHY